MVDEFGHRLEPTSLVDPPPVLLDVEIGPVDVGGQLSRRRAGLGQHLTAQMHLEVRWHDGRVVLVGSGHDDVLAKGCAEVGIEWRNVDRVRHDEPAFARVSLEGLDAQLRIGDRHHVSMMNDPARVRQRRWAPSEPGGAVR